MVVCGWGSIRLGRPWEDRVWACVDEVDWLTSLTTRGSQDTAGRSAIETQKLSAGLEKESGRRAEVGPGRTRAGVARSHAR
jgi:hypothetical protein